MSIIDRDLESTIPDDEIKERANKAFGVSDETDSLIDALSKLRCPVCGRKVKNMDWIYCSEACRKKVLYQQRGGKYIKEQRKALLLSQRKLAAKIGVTKETIGSWERGVTKPRGEHFDRLFAFFEKHHAKISEICNVTGPFLRELRESYGLSQKQFASILGVSKATIGNWERKVHEPDFSYQKKLKRIIKNPKKLTEKIPQRKCAICGGVLPPRAKKYCRNECRRKAEAKWRGRYRRKAREQKTKEIAKAQPT